MEKKVNKIYEEAYSDISEKWDKFMNSHYPKLDRAIQDLKDAEKSGDAAAIKEAKDVYERTAKNIVVNNRRFNSMAEETAAKISHTNEIALAYVNDQLPGIYSLNYNAFGEEKIKGYSFSLVNESAVKELAQSDKTLLPKKKLDIPKDMQWNKKLINSQMLQGILQGENIPTMAKRLMNVTDMNRVSAIRNARTMTTAAENKGRQDSYKKATEDGVIMKRIWVATTDDRTRAWHSDLDGVAVDVDEPWENDYGEIMFPGDPHADPANVYNCRCSIRAHVVGFRWNEWLEKEVEEKPMDYEEISERYNIISGNRGKEKIYPREQKAIEDSINFMQSNFGDISDVVETIQVRKSILGQGNVGGLYDKKGEYYKKPNTVYVQRLADPSILVHEMTHAVSSEIAEYYDKFGYDSRNKFMDAMEKEAYGLAGKEVPKRTRDLLHYDRRNSDEYFSVRCEGDFGSRDNTNYHESEALIVLKKYWKAIRGKKK